MTLVFVNNIGKFTANEQINDAWCNGSTKLFESFSVGSTPAVSSER